MIGVLPIYYQIEQTIKQWITQGEYKAGDKIPSENELAAMFNVSRLTARQAISQLVQESLVVRRRGQGTFVTDNVNLIHEYNLEFTGFIDELFYQVSRSQTKWVLISKIKAPKSICGKLELPEDSEVIQIKRARFRQNRPFAYTVNYLPLELGEKIKEADLYKKPLLWIIEQDLGIEFHEAFQVIESTFADQEVAEHTQTAPGAPILFVERIMYDEKRKPVEMVQSSYRGDLYKYTVKMRKIKKDNGSVWVHGDHGAS